MVKHSTLHPNATILDTRQDLGLPLRVPRLPCRPQWLYWKRDDQPGPGCMEEPFMCCIYQRCLRRTFPGVQTSHSHVRLMDGYEGLQWAAR